MNLLLKQCTIIDPLSSRHGQKLDLLIRKGEIQNIAKKISSFPSKTKIVKSKNLHVSIGWMDLMPFSGEPGLEHRETIDTLCQAAAVGGYTAIAPAPNTYPPVDSKSAINYLKSKSSTFGVDLYPIASISSHAQGVDIAEFLDLFHAGAIAFSDGLQPIQDSGLLLRSLQYAKTFNGLIINHPYNEKLAYEGMIHEGNVSVALGMKGIPSMSEEIMLNRDLELLIYSKSRLHVLNISSKGSLKLIQAAKKKGLEVSASVPVMNLVHNDTSCEDFNENFKVLPPLREESDRQTLVKGIKNGQIDVITSNHVPHDPEAKSLEFSYSAFGAIGLETCFPIFNTTFPDQLDLFVEKVAYNPRKILGISAPEIRENTTANLTVFDPSSEFEYNLDDIRSLSKNSPYIGKSFIGKVIGIVNGNKFIENRL